LAQNEEKRSDPASSAPSVIDTQDAPLDAALLQRFKILLSDNSENEWRQFSGIGFVFDADKRSRTFQINEKTLKKLFPGHGRSSKSHECMFRQL
jgi:hypothetical protein